MKDNERQIIERKTCTRMAQQEDNGMYDPMLEDMRASKASVGRQGDAASGLDAGLEVLEGMSFAPAAATVDKENGEPSLVDHRPLWDREEVDAVSSGAARIEGRG